jgi:hypothetical protein
MMQDPVIYPDLTLKFRNTALQSLNLAHFRVLVRKFGGRMARAQEFVPPYPFMRCRRQDCIHCQFERIVCRGENRDLLVVAHKFENGLDENMSCLPRAGRTPNVRQRTCQRTCDSSRLIWRGTRLSARQTGRLRVGSLARKTNLCAILLKPSLDISDEKSQVRDD